MKNIVILVYLIFAGFIYFNNHPVTETVNQNNLKLQYFPGIGSHDDFAIILPGTKHNHKLNHGINFKSLTAYLNDVAEFYKLVKFPASRIFSYKRLILCNRAQFLQVDNILPIFTQSAKTIQTEFLII